MNVTITILFVIEEPLLISSLYSEYMSMVLQAYAFIWCQSIAVILKMALHAITWSIILPFTVHHILFRISAGERRTG